MIRLEGVHRVFQVGTQEVHALDAVDLKVETGEYLSIMGPSGSGKSTLLNLIGLLDRPTAGHYYLNDEDVSGLEDARQAYTRRRYIGFVFQFFHLVPRLTAARNVELPLILDGVAPAERAERVDAALADVGLADRAHHRPDQLSGGQRQRVAIARATIMRPRVLLADEPTGNLDQASGSDVLRVLEDLHEQGIVLMIVTHDASIGARAHRAIRMVDGRIVSDKQQ